MECVLDNEPIYHELAECIASALDAKDPYTGNHSRRVSDMACELCGLLGLNEHDTEEIHLAAHLHDIGKIGIPDSVLLKPGRLDDEEWLIMKKHPQIGADILAKSPRFSRMSAIILHHHERFDGKGYPFGAKGEEIPLGSRIIAVCDSIHANDPIVNHTQTRIAVNRQTTLRWNAKSHPFHGRPNLRAPFGKPQQEGQRGV